MYLLGRGFDLELVFAHAHDDRHHWHDRIFISDVDHALHHRLVGPVAFAQSYAGKGASA